MTYTLPPKPPKRPRRRRLVYVVGAIVLLLASAVLFLQVLASKSEAAYRAKGQALRDAGEPLTVVEVCEFGAIPEEQNAAIPLRKAAALVPDLDVDTWRKFDPWPFVVPLSATERDLARQVAGPADEIERLVREAAQRRATHWQVKITGRMIDAPFPDLNQQRPLAQAIDYSILLATDRGDFAAGFQKLTLILTIERAMQTHPSVVGYLVSAGIESMAMARLEDLSARMKIGTAAGCVSPDQVRAMMALLADDPGETSAVRHAFRGDRAQVLQITEMLADGTLPDGTQPDLMARFSLYVQRSRLWNGCATVIDTYAEYESALGAANWPTGIARLPNQSRYARDSNPVHKMLHITMPSLLRVAKYPYEMRTRRRLAQVGLAIHLFAAENGGARPKSLDELVPRYLPSIPIDDLAADGAGIRYVPGDAALLYSVGEDGIDDGGEIPKMKPIDPGDVSFIRPVRHGGDILFRLTPQPRVEPAPEDLENTPDEAPGDPVK